MFESSTNAYVYKYQDLYTKSIEYISVEELVSCDWQDAVMPLVGKNNKAPVVIKTKNSKEVLANVANKSTKRKPSYSFEAGPPKSIFNAAPLEEGLKRNRKNII